MKTKITSVILSVVLVLSMMVHYAPQVRAEGEPPTTPPVEVSNYGEFMTAIINAENGDVIDAMGVIEIPAASYQNDMGKNITLRRGTADGRIIIKYEAGAFDTTLGGFTFDGGNLTADAPYIGVEHNAVFQGVSIINCVSNGNGGAVSVTDSTVSFTDCVFDNNKCGLYGGHLHISGMSNVTIENCTFTNGYAPMNGGAINNLATCTITSSTIAGNACDGSGGGIASTGALTITNSKIYANTATQGGADIANGIWGNLTLNDSIETLTSIFESDGLIPVGWVYDYPTAPIVTPGNVEPLQYTLLKLAFEDNTPPTVAPAPQIVYVEVPVYVPASTSTTDTTTTPEPITEEPTGDAITPRLVCGDAVLDATRRDYLYGYADTYAGQNAAISRGQAAQVIFKLLTADSVERLYNESCGFNDVTGDDWFNVYVATLQSAGIVSGCGNGLYQPERPLTRGEMLTLFTRFVEPRTDQDIQLEHWSSGAVRTAASLGWIEYDDDYSPNDEITVQEFIDFVLFVFQWANN